ncbi:N5-glutamine methyltransferase family protein [Pseudomonas bharatica]|uniref:N5-glutamine methyltransferase family protein n=1 Tax=Pseudomonas bharatica TaxID=2692112 RepID=UPI003B2887A7
MILCAFEHYQALALRELSEAGLWDPQGDLQAITDKHFKGGRALDPQRLDAFRDDIAERCSRIPLGHILGYADFDGRRLLVGSGTFVPRRQSLAMVRWIERNLALTCASTVYDLCAGVGAIGLAIWAATAARTVCVDNDSTARTYLQRNIRRLDAQREVSVLAADITRPEAFATARGRVDVVVSNPPYVPPGSELLPEWGEHHPPGAIYARRQGAELIVASAVCAAGLLRAGGVVLIEHGETQSEQVAAALERHGFQAIHHCRDDDFSDATGASVFTVGRAP